jgi:hypothetical protein
MRLPRIGDTITIQWGLDLCRYFGMEYLVDRLEAHPERYEEWKFDGCSCLPDKLLGLFTGCKWQDITYQCCLPHDLGYAYGEPGNQQEKQMVDAKFFEDLKKKARMKGWIAGVFRKAVEIGGSGKLNLFFSWAFAYKNID